MKCSFLLAFQLFYAFKTNNSTSSSLQTSAANADYRSLLTFATNLPVPITYDLITKNQYTVINSRFSRKKDLSTTTKQLSIKKVLFKYSDPISYLVLSIVFVYCVFIFSIITMGLGIFRLYILYLFLTISTSILCLNTSITLSSVRIYLFISLFSLKHLCLLLTTTFITFCLKKWMLLISYIIEYCYSTE